MPEDELIELEREGWEALSTSGDAAGDFYERVLADEVVMLLPGGMKLDDRAQIIESMSGQPWSQHELEDIRARLFHEDVGLVTYGVVAQREGQEYSALISSTYAREGNGWKLVHHQQTPR